jgi:tyrosine-protein kinase Etk/Wzc
MEQKDSLIGVLRTLFKWKTWLIIITLTAAIGSAIIVLILPVYYQAITTFYAASPDLAMPERIFGTSNEAMEYYGEEEDIDRLLTIANSNQLADFLIDSFGLYEHYDIDRDDPLAGYWVKETFYGLYDVKKTKFNALELSVEDTDPELAAVIANTARKKIDEMAQRLVKESQWQVIITYENSITENNQLLTALSDSLQSIRSEFGVFNSDSQSELLATLLAESEAKYANAEARLEAYQSSQGIPRDSIILQNARVQALKREVETLTSRMDLFSQGLGNAQVLDQMHKEASEQLSEDQERYKQIKTAFNSYFPAVHLVEEAGVPIIKSRPARTVTVLVATLIAFLLGIVGILIFDTYRDVNWKEIIRGK